MLDFPLVSRDRAFDRLRPPPDDVPAQDISWHPRLVLVPAWRLSTASCLFKRSVDLVCALTGLIVLALPVLFIMLLIRLDSPGPALFRQQRIGLLGHPFVMLKFRTLQGRADRPGTLRQVTRGDPRVTRMGRWLRRWSLDELPQLFNVLRGDMSIVGPRPHAPGTRAGGRLFEDVTHRYATRHCVKPGMTGLAQIRGWRGETDTEDKLLRRIDSDLEYIATWSPRLDLSIMWRTIASVTRAPNAY